MSQAIHTRVLPPTNHRPKRYQARCWRKTLTFSAHTLQGDTDFDKHISIAKCILTTLFREDDDPAWLQATLTTGFFNNDYYHIIIPQTKQ